ncbi:GEP3 [Candida pseudojiufengensis]|uniref:GEP3 n=1 Tax=Candida pseudojiufengensis TaxID=497109 RepID=UPI00222510E7|nr:GEP3 [Candida pseudojiufengensis]KAI5960951.1 GEP3 [Candida pseudojiufengensis]
MMLILRQFLKTTKFIKGFRYQSSIALPFLYNLDPKCRSCGIKLQDTDSSKPGFYIKSSKELPSKNKFVKHENQVYDSLLQNLDKEDQDLLITNNFNVSKNNSTSQIPLNEKGETVREVIANNYKINDYEKGIDCIRCRNITFNSNFEMNKENFLINDLSTVLSKLPSSAPLVYLFNSLDFPMGFNSDILKFREPEDIYLIMTKLDNLIHKPNNAIYNYTKEFLSDYFYKKYKIPSENIFLASCKENWKLKELYHFLPNGSYIIGNTNCGKSTLIKSLLLEESLESKKSNLNIKLSNALIKNPRDKYIKSFNQKVGPGVSYLPGFTRDIIPINIGLKTLYDVPGFKNYDNQNMHNLYDSIKNSKDINRLIKGSKTFKNGTHKSKYITYKGPQVLNFEGLGYLELPEGSMYQIKNITNIEINNFKDINKIKEITCKEIIPKELSNQFLIFENLNKYNKYLIPPFYGSIDLIFENFGYINIKPVGSKSTNKLMKLYLYPGLNSIIRQPIINYINKSFSGVDKNGNKLRKENLFTKSTFSLKKYNGKAPFSSQLIPDENNEYDEINSNLTPEEERASKKLQEYTKLNRWLKDENKPYYNDDYKINDENKYEFWKE